MFTFNISLTVLLSVAVLLSGKKLQVEAEKCYGNSYCSGYNEYCCKGNNWESSVCRHGGCVGQSCSLNSDCGGPGECCSSSKYCTKSSCTECSSNSDCGYNKYCCKQEYYWQSNVCGSGGCVGQSCSLNSDCGGPGECCSSTNYCTRSSCTECSSNSDCGYKYCCKNPRENSVCVSGGCVGQSCSLDKDCGGPGECCSSSNYCTESRNCVHNVTKALASWLIAVIVVSVLLAVVIPIAIVVCFYRGMTSASRGRSQQGQVLNQPTDSTVVTLRNTQTVQNNPSQFQNSFYAPPPYFEDQDVASQEPLSQDLPPAYTAY